jgi:hypothetical protein
MINKNECCLVNPAGSDALSIWWIDDCFTNANLDDDTGGGYMPMVEIINRNVSCDKDNPSQAYYHNGRVFAMLCTIAKSENMNFYCSSFENAMVNWPEINREKCMVLVDIGYEGFCNKTWNSNRFFEDTFGVDFVQDQLGGAQSKAMIVFLTIDPERVMGWVRKHKKWVPGMSPAIRKIIRGEPPFIPDVEIGALINHFKSRQPRRVSDLSKIQYQKLRNALYNCCVEVYQREELTSPLFTHHMTDGGTGEPEKYNSYINELAKLCINDETGLLLNLPEFRWSEVNAEDPFSFDRPPVRALAQFDKEGKDLSKFLKSLTGEIENMDGDSFAFQLITPTLEANYLWFNASAFGYALFKLASGFKDEIGKLACTADSTFVVRVFENINGNSIKFMADVTQILYPKVGALRFLPIPKSKSSTGKVKQSYETLHKAGFAASPKNGSLWISVKGKRIDEISPWLIK